jgi:hypothetical protein
MEGGFMQTSLPMGALSTKIGSKSVIDLPYFHHSWCHAPKSVAWELIRK